MTIVWDEYMQKLYRGIYHHKRWPKNILSQKRRSNKCRLRLLGCILLEDPEVVIDPARQEFIALQSNHPYSVQISLKRFKQGYYREVKR